MKNIMERLYNGEIYPAEQILPDSPDYWTVLRESDTVRAYLCGKLEKADGKKLEHLHNLYMQQSSMECYAGFAYGLKLGILLALEIAGQGNM